MSGIPLWAVPVYVVVECWEKYTPRRYALPGKTRVEFHQSWPADVLIGNICTKPMKRLSTTGTVVRYATDYTCGAEPGHPYPARSEGAYLRNTKFPSGYIVLPDESEEERLVSATCARLISSYGFAIPALTEMSTCRQRVGDLPVPLVTFPGKKVRLVSDHECVERNVHRIFFTPAGTPLYEIEKTPEEVADRKAEVQSTGNTYVTSTYEVHGLHVGQDLVTM